LRDRAELARPLFLMVLPVRAKVAGMTLLGTCRLMPYVPAPSMTLLVIES